MSGKATKVAAGIVVIVGALVYLAASGFNESTVYYRTVDELFGLGKEAYGSRVRVAGNVVEGSIVRESGVLTFEISNGGRPLPVQYHGDDPVPDTFVDGAEAVVEGVYTTAGYFSGERIQAKCASKYEKQYSEAVES